jgi:iron complex outermembrane receptor protein
MRKLHSRRLLAALSQAALSVTAVHAQSMPASVVTLSEVVVTAARMPQDPSLMPQGVQVITAQDIQAAGMTNANEAIRWLGGVIGRTDTTGGRDQTLDLRGFGEAASSNVVVLVDGVRQNEGDSTGIALSWIPISSIERIEIVRGNGSVLHGEGATAGVINIITSKGLAEPGGAASLSLGSLASRDAHVSIRTVTGPWRLQVHANAFNTDNHRENFARQERNALARATWLEGPSQLSLQLGAQSASGGLPGGITPADFLSNPRKSYKLKDSGKSDKSNLLLSGEMPVSDWRVALDVSRRLDQVESDYVSDGYTTSSRTRSSRVGARGWKEFDQGTWMHRSLAGVDAERWMQDRNKGGTNVDQASDAFYARHEINVKELGLKTYVGARRTIAARKLSGSAQGSLEANNTSWDLGAALSAGQTGEIFSRLGTSFRLANADEFACYLFPGGPACPPVTLLQPQTSRDMELGYRQSPGWGQWSARFYRSDLRNEIGYNPLSGGNINFDPTRREGIEVDANIKLGKAVDAGLQFAHRRAIFRGGAYSGKEVPMVPAQSLTARLTYRLSETQRVSVTSQAVSAQRVTDDFSNSCSARIAGYGILNARYSETFAVWTLSAVVNNLADKQFYNFRTRCNAALKSVYPEPGRTFNLMAQRSF